MNKYSKEEKECLLNLGSKIREIRRAKGMVQQQLAALCNSEKASLSRIESGKTNATVITLQKIAAVLEVPISDLLVVSSRTI